MSQPLVITACGLKYPGRIALRETVRKSLVIIFRKSSRLQFRSAIQKGRKVDDAIGCGKLMGDPESEPRLGGQRLYSADWRILTDVQAFTVLGSSPRSLEKTAHLRKAGEEISISKCPQMIDRAPNARLGNHRPTPPKLDGI